MNKGELVSAVAEKTGLTKTDVEKVLNGTIEAVTETVAKGEEVALIGFGTWKLNTRAARTGINPLTKKKLDIPEKKVPAFKAGAKFKAACAPVAEKKPAKKAAKTSKKK